MRGSTRGTALVTGFLVVAVLDSLIINFGRRHLDSQPSEESSMRPRRKRTVNEFEAGDESFHINFCSTHFSPDIVPVEVGWPWYQNYAHGLHVWHTSRSLHWMLKWRRKMQEGRDAGGLGEVAVSPSQSAQR